MKAPPPKQRKVKSHTIEIAVLDYGNESAPPMLLVHGMRDLAWSLDCIGSCFREHFRVVSVDLRGHGDSDNVGYYALPHFILDVRQVIKQMDLERPLIVGHSFGGELVAQFSGLFPEVPRGLVLVEGLGPPLWEREGSREAGAFWQRSMIERLDLLDPNGRQMPDLEAAIERILKNPGGLDPERARFLTEKGTQPHPDGGLGWKWDPFLMTSWGSHNFQQTEEMWAHIECPTLAVNGAESGAFWARDLGPAGAGGEGQAYLPPDELQRRLDCFADIECVEIAGAGHMVHFDQPDALNAAMEEFIDRRKLL